MITQNENPGGESWHESHTGPESSGNQENEVNEKGGGAGKTNDDGSIHYTDFDDKGNRVSWDEKNGEKSGHHSTPSKK